MTRVTRVMSLSLSLPHTRTLSRSRSLLVPRVPLPGHPRDQGHCFLGQTHRFTDVLVQTGGRAGTKVGRDGLR